jgi:hypothetical protein
MTLRFPSPGPTLRGVVIHVQERLHSDQLAGVRGVHEESDNNERFSSCFSDL